MAKKRTVAAPPKRPTKRHITIERTYKATVDEVWRMWTTKRGIESFWGPDGFVVEVLRLEVRAGGVLDYTMTATGSDQIEFLEKAGMPLSSLTHARFTEVSPRKRLGFDTTADFIPGVEPYEVATLVELHAVPGGVKLVLTIDAMHDEQWTELAVMGWKSELDRLGKALGE